MMLLLPPPTALRRMFSQTRLGCQVGNSSSTQIAPRIPGSPWPTRERANQDCLGKTAPRRFFLREQAGLSLITHSLEATSTPALLVGMTRVAATHSLCPMDSLLHTSIREALEQRDEADEKLMGFLPWRCYLPGREKSTGVSLRNPAPMSEKNSMAGMIHDGAKLGVWYNQTRCQAISCFLPLGPGTRTQMKTRGQQKPTQGGIIGVPGRRRKERGSAYTWAAANR